MSLQEYSTLDSTSSVTIMKPAAADSDTSCRAGKGKEVRTKPQETNVAETSAERTATDRGALETNAGSGFPGTLTPAEIGTRERRGRTTVAETHPGSSSAHPCNGNPPSGSGCCCWPCHSGCHNHVRH